MEITLSWTEAMSRSQVSYLQGVELMPQTTTYSIKALMTAMDFSRYILKMVFRTIAIRIMQN